MKWIRHVACVEVMRSAYEVLVRKTEEETSLGISVYNWGDIIKKDRDCVDWIDLGPGMDRSVTQGWRASCQWLMNNPHIQNEASFLTSRSHCQQLCVLLMHHHHHHRRNHKDIYKYTQNFNQEVRFILSKPWLHLFLPHHPLIHHF